MHLQPLRIIDHGGRVDGAVDAELLEGEVEEGSPLPEVLVIHGQGDRNVTTDVKEDEGGGRGRDGFVRRSKGIGAGGYRTGGARHG